MTVLISAAAGPVELWVEELTRFTPEFGVDAFVYWPSGDSEDPARRIELFASEIAPVVREAVGKEGSMA